MSEESENINRFYSAEEIKEAVRRNEKIISELFVKIIEYKAENDRLKSMLPEKEWIARE